MWLHNSALQESVGNYTEKIVENSQNTIPCSIVIILPRDIKNNSDSLL